jgi:hypothetical protein
MKYPVVSSRHTYGPIEAIQVLQNLLKYSFVVPHSRLPPACVFENEMVFRKVNWVYVKSLTYYLSQPLLSFRLKLLSLTYWRMS